ncbi:secreted protein [Beggiatoa sp. PS]|nr:secreted protein [Beggiatoa sp. PS]
MKQIYNTFLAVLLGWILAVPSSADIYTYDDINRLISVTHYETAQITHYTYDAGGNILSVITTDLPKYDINAYIKDQEDNPIADVSVTINAQTVTSDENGYIQMTDLLANRYMLTAQKNGYFFAPQNLILTDENLNLKLEGIVVTPASCQLYAVNDKGLNHSQFLTINLDTHEVNQLGPLYPSYDIEALAIHPETNLIYAASGDDAMNGNNGYLYLVDAQTGELFSIGYTGFDEIEDLAFGNDGTLWAWSKGNGLITLDLVTGVGTLAIPSDKLVEGLTLSKEPNHTVFYGSVNTELLIYDLETDRLDEVCTNLLGETEALEMMPDDLLLISTHQDTTFSLHAFDPKICQIVEEANIPTEQFNDVEGIALPVEACAK